jgi:carbohydrate-binding DOMON domain-containing protein
VDTLAVRGGAVELALPLELLAEAGEAQVGDRIRFQIVAVKDGQDRAVLPRAGPIEALIPDPGDREYLVVVADPVGDDHGPGGYVYPTDPVFEPGVFDIRSFSVGLDEGNVVFTFGLNGPIDNVWGSGVGFSLQTLDIYVDTDPGEATGARRLLEGRNAVLPPDHGWEYALWVEGWHQKVFTPDELGRPVEQSGSPLRVLVDPDRREITIRIARSALPADTDPGSWGFVAALLSQEGFPSTGVRRVRDVLPTAARWRIGGGPAHANHTRIMDLAWPAGASPTQEEMLRDYYPALQSDRDLIPVDDYAAVPLIRVPKGDAE